jgi:ubiquinone/menaquinone biosynthesis C-methylase UbiE
MDKKRHIATEQRSVEEILEELAGEERWAEVIFSRLSGIVNLPHEANVLDVGAASGGFLVACRKLGYQCVGIEPWQEARLNASRLSERLNVPINIVDGMAEAIPYSENMFHVVHASSVMEHVEDLEGAFKEAYRVLKPGGVFWFNSASAMCPRQGEIRGIPFFGWYPDSLKFRIMNWVKDYKPHLVGHTRTPAINWFTPWKARALLRKHGFRQVYDRWDLRRDNEGGTAYRLALRAIRTSKLSKTLADVFVPACSYAAIK